MFESIKNLIKPKQKKYFDNDLKNLSVSEGIYIKYFLEALKTSQELSLKIPDINLQPQRLITDAVFKKIPKHITQYVGLLSIEEVAGQCISWHYRIKEPLEELLNTELYYTIGYVENQFDKRFYHDKNDIISLLKSGSAKPELNVHTWLTLPSMEIIDYSLLSMYAVAFKRPDHYFALLAEHADELKNGMRYHPTLIGDDFLKKIGAITKINLVR